MFPRRYLKVATIVACVLVAAAPPLGFARFMDGHVVDTAEHTLAGYAERIISRVEATVQDGTSALTALHRTGAVGCDLRGREALRRAVAGSRMIKEIVVSGEAGQCASLPVATRYAALSDHLSISATTTLFVTSDEQDRRALAVEFRPSEEQLMIAYFLPETSALDMLPEGWRRQGHVLLMLNDKTIFEVAPAVSGDSDHLAAPVITSELTSARFPVTARIGVAKSAVMQDFAGLRTITLAVMALFAGLVAAIAAVIARRYNMLSDEIAAGLRRGEFIPYYQPLLNLATGRLSGCEVLVRRRRRNGTIDLPGPFIAQAEFDGQIIAMTRQLMRQVIEDLGEIYGRNRKLKVGFNLCAKHFQDDRVIADIKRIFGRSPIVPSQLIFEVTERSPLIDMAKSKTIIAELQALGASVALDDAGTGHSGLAALHRLGMDIVKIDKLFIDSITAETTHAPIVDSLIELAKSFGMSVVAEGVETLDQLTYLRAKGVDSVQGYLLAPPLPASSYLALLEALQPRDEEAEAEDAAAA